MGTGKRLSSVLVVLSISFLVFGCPEKQEDFSKSTRSSAGFMDLDKVYAEKEWVDLLGPVTERGAILARVNGEAIRREDLDSLLVKVTATRARSKRPIDPESMRVVRANTLDTLILQTLEKQEAVRRNIPVDKAKVDELYGKYVEQFGGEEALAKALLAHGETTLTFREVCANHFRIEKLREEALDRKIDEPTEQDIRNHWAGKENTFINLNASQIFFKTPETMSEAEREEKRTYAERVRKQINEDGSNFAELAAKESEHKPTAEKGGDMGKANLAALDPEIAAVLKNKPVGWISDVEDVPGGFAIFRITNVAQLTLENLKQAVIDDWKKQRRMENYSNWLREVRDRSSIRILDDGIKRTLAEIAAGT